MQSDIHTHNKNYYSMIKFDFQPIIGPTKIFVLAIFKYLPGIVGVLIRQQASLKNKSTLKLEAQVT